MSLQGEDLSHWQGTGSVDGAPDFVILKATGGDDGLYVDQDCDNKYQRAKSEGKLLGIYHFAGMTDPIAEANFFVDNTTGYWQAREAILVLDNETHTDVGWALAFLNQVQARTGVKPLIYMSASTIKEANWQPVVDGDFGLWVAGYPAQYNILHPSQTDGSDMPYDISPWGFAAIWQYSSSAGTLDEDVAMMSATAWGLYAGQSAPIPQPPAPTPPAPVVTTAVVTETKAIPFDKHTITDPTLDNTYSQVTQIGVDGVETLAYTVTYTDNVETGRVLSSDTVTTAAIPEVTTVGTKVPVVTPPAVTEPWWKPILRNFLAIFGIKI